MQNKKQRGFSFIELIITITIIMIMTSTILLISSRDRTQREVEAMAREVAANIRETQNNALTGKQRGEGLPCAFSFSFSNTPGGASILIKGSYRAIDEQCPDSDVDLSAHNVEFLKKTYPGKTIRAYSSVQEETTVGGTTGSDGSVDYVVFSAPFGFYHDAHSDKASSDIHARFANTDPFSSIRRDSDTEQYSKGSEFIISAEKSDIEYHICMHSTGLLEEMGVVVNTGDAAACSSGKFISGSGGDKGQCLVCTF